MMQVVNLVYMFFIKKIKSFYKEKPSAEQCGAIVDKYSHLNCCIKKENHLGNHMTADGRQWR